VDLQQAVVYIAEVRGRMERGKVGANEPAASFADATEKQTTI
jgi:hypothetical protein